MNNPSSSSELPIHASVVVIGGGIMGCSTLYHLAAAGVGDAVLLERNKLTSGTTWHSAAQVRALRSTRNLTDLIRYSIDLYSKLEAETGQQVGWINRGSLSIATQPDRMVHIRRQHALAEMYCIPTQTISPGEAKERWPLMNADDVIGAVWSPDDGRVSPSDLCAALIKGARERGVKLFEGTGVTGILTKHGRIYGVETDRGTISTGAVALCTGLWSHNNAARAGVDVPVWPCEHFYLLTKPVEGIEGNLPTLSDHDGHLYIRDDSGGLLVGCFEPLAKAIDPNKLGDDFSFQLLNEDWVHFEPMMHNALHRLPVLQDAEVKMLLNGPESFTPDGSFLLGEAAETAGFFLGCGMNSVGIATGGGAGMALANCILHGAPPMDLHEADPRRFDTVFNNISVLSERVPEVLGKHYEIAYPGRQWVTARNLRKLPLQDEWEARKAHFGQVFGYERPLYFNKTREPKLTFGKPDWFDHVKKEVDYATKGCAIIDLSSFGKIEIIGPDASAFLNRLCTNNMMRAPGRVVYTLMLNKSGGIVADLTALRLNEEHYRLSVGTAARKHNLAWLRQHAKDQDIKILDVTEDITTLGIMGPGAKTIAKDIGADWLNGLRYFHNDRGRIGKIEVMAARLSYIGEAGWEISCSASDADGLFQIIANHDAEPIGSFAQTSMRLETGFLSYGHDIDTDTTPGMVGLEFTLDESSQFIGKQPALDSIKKNQKCIVSLIIEDESAVPLGNEPVLYEAKIIGKTTSASFGYRIGQPIALALIESQFALNDQKLLVDIAGNRFAARAVIGAAYDPAGKKMH